ncbi:MAG: peptidylprolyl isomerase [Bacteroidota bacterium]
MPIMTKMRDNMGTIILILVAAFVGMIVFEWGMDYLGLGTQSTNVLGAINGQEIYYAEFAELVRNAAENQKAQTGKEPEEEDLRVIREQVWDQLVTQVLLGAEIDRLGITATDEEILDWVRGDSPPEFLARQFQDSTGALNRAAYEQALADPRNSQIWVQVESMLRQQRKQEKLQSLLFALVRVTESEIRRRFIDQNIRMEAEYALFDANRLIPDSLVELSGKDLRRYYDEHQVDYRVAATRKLKYVLLSDRPSKADSQAVHDELLDLKRQALAGADFVDLLETYSEIPFTDAFFKHGELSFAKETLVFDAKVGEIVDPVADFDGYHLMKVLADRRGKDEFIRGSHILLRFERAADSLKTWELAKELKKFLAAGEEFSTLAIVHSKDPGSAARGGDLGWFGKGRMVKEFEEAAFKARVGQVVGPVKTQFGLHLIKVRGRSKREVKIADIFMSLKASPRTRNEAYEDAADFAYISRKGEFEKEAKLSNYAVRETAPFAKGGVIPGIGANETISAFAFENDLGDISEPIRIQGGYSVFMIAEKNDERIKPFEEVEEAIRPRLLREKKIEKVGQMAKDLHASLGPEDSLSVLKKAAPSVMVQRTPPFTPNISIGGIGRDNVFLGVSLGLEVGKTSKPFEGSRGYYVVRLLSKTEFDSTTYNAQHDILRDQILSEKKTRFLTEWIEDLKKKADIEDFRDRFYL